MARDDVYDDYEDDDRRGEEVAHRGGLVLSFGIISILMFFMCGPVGLPLGILAWVWGARDLKRMDAGEMDPEGRGTTQGGMITGIIGTVLGVLSTLAIIVYALFFVVLVGAAAVGK